MANVKKRVSFNLVIWVLVAVFAFYNTCWPLVENEWAAYMWDKVPCAYREGSKFLFEYQGKRYYAIRDDFWERDKELNSVLTASAMGSVMFDHICYVKPGDPKWAVRNVDAEKHIFDHGFKGLMVAVLIVIAGIILTFASNRVSKQTPAPPATGN